MQLPVELCENAAAFNLATLLSNLIKYPVQYFFFSSYKQSSSILPISVLKIFWEPPVKSTIVSAAQ